MYGIFGNIEMQDKDTSDNEAIMNSYLIIL